MALPMGRPSLYTQDILDKAQDYVENYRKHGDLFPFMAGLSLAVGVSKATCYLWCKDEDKKDFLDIVESMNAIQERELLKNGMLGSYNPTITKLVLSKHGYSEKSEVDHTSSDKSMQPVINISFGGDDE